MSKKNNNLELINLRFYLKRQKDNYKLMFFYNIVKLFNNKYIHLKLVPVE